MRLTCVIPSLRSGGAARTLTHLLRGWVERGYEPTVITVDAGERDLFDVPEDVALRSLGLMADSSGWAEGLLRNARRVRRLRAELRHSEPDVVLALLHRTAVRTLAASVGLAAPVVVAEHTDPVADRLAPPWRAARRLTYRTAAAIVVLTERHARWARQRFPRIPVRVIPNPALPPSLDDRVAPDAGPGPELSDAELLIVAVGRLAEEKGFDLLLEAFARTEAHRRGARLAVVGEGPERERLEALRTRLKLGDAVSLPGRTSDPDAWLEAADLFVLSSRREAFPNVLLEAMAAGVPPVAADCPAGPAEIVRHGEDGWLVESGDSGALAEAIDRLAADDRLRRRLADRAPEVLDRYGMGRVLDAWNELFRSVGALASGAGREAGRDR